MKRYWYVFYLLSVVFSALNPYVGLFAMFPGVFFMIDCIVLATIRGRNRSRYRYEDKIPVAWNHLGKKINFIMLVLWNLIFLILGIVVNLFFSFTAERKVFNSFLLNYMDVLQSLWFTLMIVLVCHTVGSILFIIRLHEEIFIS